MLLVGIGVVVTVLAIAAGHRVGAPTAHRLGRPRGARRGRRPRRPHAPGRHAADALPAVDRRRRREPPRSSRCTAGSTGACRDTGRGRRRRATRPLPTRSRDAGSWSPAGSRSAWPPRPARSASSCPAEAGRCVSRGGVGARARRPSPAASGGAGLPPRRPEPVLHAERRVLSGRHCADRAVGARRGLEPAGARHGRARGHARFRAAHGAAADRARHHARLCLERGGRPYVGNARWIGAPLADLLAEAGVDPARPSSSRRRSTASPLGTPMKAVTDGRDAMLAIAMNGEPLPIEHGFPVRMVVPGLYGYVSATKWLVDLELTTFDAFDPYWIRRGWAEQAPIKTQSRIDTPEAAREPSGRRCRDRRRRVGSAPGIDAGRGACRRRRLAAGRARDRGHDRHLAAVADRDAARGREPPHRGARHRRLRARCRPTNASTRSPTAPPGQHSIVIQVG